MRPLPRAHDMRGAIVRLAARAVEARPRHAAAASWTSNSATLTTSTTSSSSLFYPGRSSSSQRPVTATRAASSSSSPSSSSPASSIENLAAAAPKRPPRFFVEPEQLSTSCSSGSVVLLPASEARHARKVLRLRPGASLELCDGRGRVAKAALLGSEEDLKSSDPASARVEGPILVVPEQLPRLRLAVAALGLKSGRGDWLVEKAAELGAASLVPLSTERSPASDRDKEEAEDEGEDGEGTTTERRRWRRRSSSSSAAPSPSRASRWRRLAEAAGKQCLRPHALRIESATTVSELAEEIRRGGGGGGGGAGRLALVAAEGAPPVAAALLREKERREEERIETVFLIVGPEGDFTPRELEELMAVGAVAVGLGENRLRVETAAEALLAVAGAMLL